MKDKSMSDIVIEVIALIIVSIVRAILAHWLWGLVMVPVFGMPALTLLQVYLLAWLFRLFLPYEVKS